MPVLIEIPIEECRSILDGSALSPAVRTAAEPGGNSKKERRIIPSAPSEDSSWAGVRIAELSAWLFFRQEG